MMLATMVDDRSCALRMLWKGRRGYGVGFTRSLRKGMLDWRMSTMRGREDK